MRQKQSEFIAVEPILKQDGLTIVPREHNESPDFVVQGQDGALIGIEVTEARYPFKHQIDATEDVVDKLLKEYSALRKERFTGLFLVNIDQDLIHMGCHFKPLKEELFNELDCIFSNEPHENNIVKSSFFIQDGSFSVTRSIGHCSRLRPLPQIVVDMVITKKEQKLKEYKAKLENAELDIKEYWLVINVPMKEGWDLSYANNPSVSTTYDHVYLVDVFNTICLK